MNPTQNRKTVKELYKKYARKKKRDTSDQRQRIIKKATNIQSNFESIKKNNEEHLINLKSIRFEIDIDEEMSEVNRKRLCNEIDKAVSGFENFELKIVEFENVFNELLRENSLLKSDFLSLTQDTIDIMKNGINDGNKFFINTLNTNN